MTGPMRALCYRIAVATGLRYSEIASITSEAFDGHAPSVTVAAAYMKNAEPGDAAHPERSGRLPGLGIAGGQKPTLGGERWFWCALPVPEDAVK
jgi:hypothetical protein